MLIISPAKRLGQRSRPGTRGPEVTFTAAVVTAFAALAACAAMFPADIVLPAVSTLLFVMACLVALVAWRSGHTRERSHVTYWDVAGALTLLGICVASQIDPDQMVRLVEGARRGH